MANYDIDSSYIIKTLKENTNELKRFSIKRIGLFGSFVHGLQNENSDIDLLVEFKEPTLKNFINLTEFLESLFKRKIEIVTPDGIESIRIKKIKEDIKRSIVYV